jgi:hypothetical protein
VTSALASGGAAFLAKFQFNAAKAVARAEVDDFAGGKMNVPLFVFEFPQADAEPPSWSDLLLRARGREFGHALEAAGDFALVASELPMALLSLIPLLSLNYTGNAHRMAYDLFARHGIGNVASAYFGIGDGLLVGAIASPGHQLDQVLAPVRESPHSTRNLIVQLFNSAAGDWTWEMTRDTLNDLKFDVAAAAASRRRIAATEAQADGTTAERPRRVDDLEA